MCDECGVIVIRYDDAGDAFGAPVCVEGVVYRLLKEPRDGAAGGSTLFFHILPLARSSSFSNCLAEYTHEFAIAMDLISPLPCHYIQELDALASCESRVCAQVLLSNELVGGFSLVLDYLNSGQS